MTETLTPYPEYRASDLPWLSEIPAHWKVRRLRYLLDEMNKRSTHGDETLLSVSQYTGVTPRRKRADGTAHTRSASLAGYKVVEESNLVVNIMLAWNGSLGAAREAGIVSPAYGVYRLRGEMCAEYVHYLLRTPLYKSLIKSSSTGVVDSRLRLYTNDLYDLTALLPPIEEQRQIARYLNAQSARVDRLIRAKQRLVALLTEQKQAVIQRAVTRGLDPDAPMKPSGVDWLGDVPAHWKVLYLKQLVQAGRKITYGIVQPGEPDPSGRFMVRGQDYSRGWSDPESIFHVSDEIERSYRRSRLISGDLVFTIVGAGVGNTAVVPAWMDGANITQTTARISIDSRSAHSQYVVRFLESPMGKANADQYVKGAAQPGLNLEHLKVFRVPTPPLDEQVAISEYIDTVTRPIGEAIQRTHAEIVLIREYRTRLVADVVTGKLNVRGASVPDIATEALLEPTEALDDAEMLNDA